MCALIYTILYKGLEHSGILVFMGGFLEPELRRYRGTTAMVKFWGSEKLYVDVLTAWGWYPYLCIIQGSTVVVVSVLVFTSSFEVLVKDISL